MQAMLFKLIPGVRTNLRNKLLALGLFPILLMLPVVLIMAIYWGKNFGYQQLFFKVNTDLSVAHNAFELIRENYKNELIHLGDSYNFRTSLASGDADALAKHIASFKKSAGFSYLHITNPRGEWSFEPADAVAGRALQSALFMRALDGEIISEVELFEEPALTQEGLFEDVKLALVATPRAKPTIRVTEDRGMMIRVLYPLKNNEGVTIAVLDGGVLLNGNFQFVDEIRDIVYGPGSLPDDSIGTVTIFIEDVRISTNVPLKKGERALGTRVSKQVRVDVFENGNTWNDLAFVVNDWYISAYEPIVDYKNKRVGMLYAGFLASPFQKQLWQMLGWLLVLFVVLSGLSMLIAIRGARQIFRPVADISRIVGEARAGNLDARINLENVEDELGDLAVEFDSMLDKLEQRNQIILQAADSLESKVEERTRELSDRNQELLKTIDLLRETRQQLVMAEKLAALGELTAGVAHEINNPLGVMLGNMDLVRSELGNASVPVDDEIDLVIEQIYRIQEIVSQLLLKSRPTDYSGFIHKVAVNKTLEDSLLLVRHIIDDQTVRLEKSYDADLLVGINNQELQQVLINLIVNAVHALPPDNGLIRLTTHNWKERGVVITVSDNGSGIGENDIDKVFDAFYTTKEEGLGTGIGLSISRSLVRRYGGNLTVESELGEGTSFRVWLLTEPEQARRKESNN